MLIHRIPGFMAYCYLVETAAALYLVDAGMTGTGSKILRRIKRLGRRPEELVAAFVTHAHADHFGGLAEVQEASGCTVICHPAHADTVRAGDGIVSPGLTFFGKAYEKVARFVLPKLSLPKLERVVPAHDGERLDRFGLSGRVLYTPGHSLGDLTLLLDDGNAFVGDLVQGRRIPKITSPEFSIMAEDEPGMFASWRTLLRSGAKVLHPGHGDVVRTEDIVPVFERASRRRRLVAESI